MSKEFQIKDGDLIASFDLENEGGDIDFCDLFKISNGVANKIGMFVDYVATNKIIKDQSKQIADLEAKLAEKEKEIEELKLDNEKYFTDSCRANKEIAYKLKQQNQKAIEQLEKIKEICKNKFEWWENSEWDGNIYDKSDVSNAYFDIEANIDQQINELKGRVENE